MLKRWDVISNLILAHDLKVGAEIGVKAGENIANILKACPDFIFYAIDCWDPKLKYLTWRKGAQFTHEKMFDRLVSAYPDNIIKKKGYSVPMAATIPDGSLDLVFIDGDHSFDGCAIDISTWLPKLKSGGIIAGHDYGHARFPGVKKVVDSFFPTIELHDDFVWWLKVA
jgi:hypothetical protein